MSTQPKQEVNKKYINVGITGQSGFIGTHLFNTLSLKRDEIWLIPFSDDYFVSKDKLEAWAKQCDVIVHLAAVNRHANEDVIYNTNIGLVEMLISAMEKAPKAPHVIFASSVQEEKDNPYGKSKKTGREMLESWALKKRTGFTGLIIPNVFGPFGRPFYNSVVATFCHQLSHNEQPQIQIDGKINLIYVSELADKIYKIIMDHEYSPAKTVFVPHSYTKKVSEILTLLESFKTGYFEQGIFPILTDSFELKLFNTFLTYFDLKNYFPVKLKQNTDERGSFVEAIKIKSGGQVSFSTTKPGITRGNHYHTRKIERFIVMKGEAIIRLRRAGTQEILSFNLNGNEPAYVDMPIWYTHNITNTGSDDLITMFWINEFYDANDPDTYYENV
jgi:UDP-2-acetamido-2,6-beta-L-arabino-hexul-4-ose reductase